MDGKRMTLGEFRKWTANLSDDVKLSFCYGGASFPIKAMDYEDENTIRLGGNLYAEKNIMGSIRVATFCKKNEGEE